MSDVQYNQSPAMMAARGQTYGKRKEQMDAQRAVPMGRSPVETPPRPTPLGPGEFTAPTMRPNEPITSGANFGPGPNAFQAGLPSEAQLNDDALREMRSIYARFPSQELADIIQFYEDATR